MAATRTKRFEARLDEETDSLITRAAELLHLTKTSFVVSALRAEAERVVARADVTYLAPEVFDALIETLDAPDEAPEFEGRLKALPRLPRL